MLDYIYGENLTRDIFLNILRFLHIADNYLYFMECPMVSICPQAEKNINKYKRNIQNLENVCDIDRKALRKNTYKVMSVFVPVWNKTWVWAHIEEQG